MNNKKYFQEVRDIYFDDELYDVMITFFPSLVKLVDKDDGKFYALSVLSNYMIENILNDTEIHKIIEFVNYSIAKGSFRTKEVLQTSVIEEVLRYNKLQELFEKSLSIEAKKLLDNN